MPKTKERVADVAGTAKPYVERALHDQELREHVKQAYGAARHVYEQLLGPRGMTGVASRAAGDPEIHENLRTAVAELRHAADRLQSGSRRQARSGSRKLLLAVGVGVGILFNPITGPDTRRWLKNKLSGGGDEFGFGDSQSGNGSTG